MTLATWITTARLAALPVFLALWSAERPRTALLILGLGLLTDFVDGRVARAMNQVTPLGALLDPIVDKACVLALFPFLYWKGLVPAPLFWITVVRDLAQLAAIPVLRTWLRVGFKVKPRMLPRVATALNFLVIWLCLADTLGGSLPSLAPLFVASFCLEAYILGTFLPRFWQIATGRHDTFE